MAKSMPTLSLLLVVTMTMLDLVSSGHVNLARLRDMAVRYNVTCVVVFGDSSVDPGNNNRLPTSMKSNYLPYGHDFFGGHPTGRFTNGRLPTDFIAEALGYTKTIPAFLDPNVKDADLIRGVSFASAASGYDDLTANLSGVLSVSKQLEYLKHYKLHMRNLLGVNKADNIISNAIFVLSMGTNDFLQNYFLEPIRPKQFTLQKYQMFLANQMFNDVKGMHRLGAKRLAIVGVPPLGCMPLVRTLLGTYPNTCVKKFNQVAYAFNAMIKQKLSILSTKFGMTVAYVDAYQPILDAINTPHKYGFVETTKGCCGTGTVEYGESCKGMETCKDPSIHIFWDAVHPTQSMYQIIANGAIESLYEKLLS